MPKSKMEPEHDSFQPELRKFLASIPDLPSTSLDSTLLIDGEESRAEWTAAITRKIQDKLAIPKQNDTEWLYELAELNHTSKDDPTFIALLLVEYIAESPWMLLKDDVESMVENRRDTFELHVASLRLDRHLSGCPHTQLNEQRESTPDIDFFSKDTSGSRNLPVDIVPQVRTRKVLVSHTDRRLGLAGLSPLPLGFRFYLDRLDLAELRPMPDSARQLEEWQSHASLRVMNSEGLALVSYQSKVSIGRSFSAEWVMARIRNVMQNIELSLKQLQRESLCCDSLIFLKYVHGPPDGNTHPSPIETVQLNFALVSKLSNVIESSLDDLKELIPFHSNPLPAPPIGGRAHNIGWHAGLLATAALVAGSGLLLVPVGAAMVVGAANRLRDTERDRERDIVQGSFSDMKEAIYSVLQLLSTPNSPSSPQQLPPMPSADPLLDLLNDLALAVQLIALVVQSYVQGTVLPFRFPFLDHSVSGFVLEGALKNPHGLKIIATSQKLSCLGDMIGKRCLGFPYGHR